MSLFILGMCGVWAPPVITITSLSPIPRQEKMAHPHARCGLGGRKRRVAQSGNLHWCSSCYKFVSSGLGTRVPSISVNGQPVLFPAPLQDHVSSRRRIGHAHLAEMSLSKACKLLQQENLSQGILWPVSFVGHPHKHPSGIITHRQIWQLSPKLEHGHVESIDQLAWYHAQFNTPMEWHR